MKNYIILKQMSDIKMSIGILGGTFNPIHIGHLIMAEYVREYYNFEKILFIPAGDPPFKDDLEVSKEDRLEMVKLAIKDNSNFIISDIEVIREGKSYTIDTIEKFKKENPSDIFYFILGQDAAFDFYKWHRYSDLISMTDIVVVVRGENLKDEIIKKNEEYKEKFHFLNTPFLEISSTDIRNRIKNKKSFRYLVTNDVYDYIIKKGLYR